jgi:uncharacterized protein (TIRG00374 family)
MSVENLTEKEPLSIGKVSDSSQSKIKNSLVWIQGVIFLAALCLLFYVLSRIGLQTIVDALKSVGWGFLAIIAFNGSRHMLRALSIYLAIPSQHHHFKYRYAVAARLGGEAVNVLSFTGPLLGEATKAALLKKRVPLSHGAAAVVVDNILYDISVILVILGGVGVMLYTYGSGDKAMRYALVIITTVALLAIVGILLAAKFRIKPLSWIIRKLSKRNLVPGFIERKRERIHDVEDHIYQFYTHRRKTFFAIFGIDFLAHTLSVCEVFVALKLLGHSATPATSYIIESLTKVINFTFGFIPGALGAYEGGNGVILKALGYSMAVGVTLALVRRGATLFWVCVGLLILLWRGVSGGARRLAKQE